MPPQDKQSTVELSIEEAPLSPVVTLPEMRALVGTVVGYSPWILVDQSRIDAFAKVTEDEQFIHVDPARAAAEAPYGGTIAHGFLTLSLLVRMAETTVPRLDTQKAVINFGFDKLRFLSPVKAGARIRGRFTLAELNERNPEQLLVRYAVSVEIEGEDRTAMVAHWLSVALINRDGVA
ncbi:MAG: MaoC family dehydratase [Rhodospirillales bacterium]